MRDHERGTSVHEGVHALLDDLLGAGVDGGGRLVQDHGRGVGDGRARNGEQLALALRELGGVVGEHGLVAVGKATDEAVRTGELCRADALLVRGAQAPVADVVHDGAGEQVHVLQHDAQGAAQVALADLVDVDAVVADLAVGDVIEAVDEVRDGGLAGTRRADERDLLAGLREERDVVQDGVVRRVAKVDVREADVARERRVRDASVVVRVLPRPGLGALGALLELAGRVLAHVHEGDVALVLLGLLVYEREDPLRTREAHDHEVDLLRHLADGAGEALRHVEERHDDGDGQGHAADGGVGEAGGEEGDARERDDDVGEVAHVHEDGHEGVAVGVSGARRLVQRVVHGVELLDGLVLVREDLDDLLAVHGLLGKSLGLRELDLLVEEVVGALAAQDAGGVHHARDHGEHDGGQRDGVPQHDGEDGDHGEEHREQVGQRLADELAQRVDVVGVVAHDVAVLVGVEVADGQALHVVEHLVAHVHERALAHDGAKLRVGDVRGERDDVARYEACGDLADLGRGAGPVSRGERVLHDVDRLLQEDGRHGREYGRRDDADDHDRRVRGVVVEHGVQDALERGAGPLGAAVLRGGRACLPGLLLGVRGLVLLASLGVATHGLPPSGPRPSGSSSRRGTACSASCTSRGRWRWCAGVRRGCRWRLSGRRA